MIKTNKYFKDINDKYFRSYGINFVNIGDIDYITKRNLYQEYIKKNYFDTNDWIKAVKELLQDIGINTLGAWTYETISYNKDIKNSFYEMPIIYCSPDNDSPKVDYTSKEFAEFAEKQIKKKVEADKNNKNIIGYFLGNEMWWGRDWRKFKNIKKEQAEAFFKTTNILLKKYAPDKLNLGVRFVSAVTPRFVVKVAAKYCDIISVNYYKLRLGLDWIFPILLGHTFAHNMLRDFFRQAKKPILISEFGFRAKTETTPSTIKWIYAKYANQKQRCKALRKYIKKALSKDYICGLHHFSFVDQPAGGRSMPPDGENNNFGIMNVNGILYNDYVNVFKEALK